MAVYHKGMVNGPKLFGTHKRTSSTMYKYAEDGALFRIIMFQLLQYQYYGNVSILNPNGQENIK